ncbi:serpin family protein [Erythrobacter colymbi]|uniref:serpin family protein n=1 Tax=Erythrobacter colymbi TaxID=1161202 RepID=UPI00138FDB05|nr:serpin family protein [Erythrobacter colymbi]
MAYLQSASVVAQDIEPASLAEAEAEAKAAIEPTISVSLNPDAQALVASTNAFSLDLLREADAPDTNLIISPASVSTAVGFAYRGAVDDTASQLKTVMRYPFDPQQNLRASGALMSTMSFSAKGRELRTANAIWLQEGMPFDQRFEQDMNAYAKAGIGRTDFRADPEGARQLINRWVEGATNGNIAELLQPRIVTTGTRAVLVNAVWFKADWQFPFSKEATRSEPFTAIDGSISTTSLMHQWGRYAAFRRDGVSVIQLPYKGGEVALVVFLPDKASALPKFEESLTSKALSRWLTDLDKTAPRETVLTLPKLKMRWHSDLAEDLTRMGAPIAFSDDADFSAMARLPYPGGEAEEIGLKISHVIHEATIEVDEVGSEASAATAVVMGIVVSGRRGPPPPPPFVFKADKPFLFALRDLRTGLLLFVGRYVRPDPLQE